MTPFWQTKDKRITVYHGSCLQIEIPKSAIAITDPPYNIGKPQLIVDVHLSNRRTIGKDFGEDFDEKAIVPSVWAGRMPDTVVSFYGAKRMEILLKAFRKAGYEVVQDFHWCKKNPPPPRCEEWDFHGELSQDFYSARLAQSTQ